MAKTVTSYKKLIALGETYKVADEEDFKAAAKTYAEQVTLIAEMRAQLKQDGMTVSKEYVKGRENVCCHPLVDALPKHVDSANRTLAIIGAIIKDRGTPQQEEADELDSFRLT